MLFIKFIDVLQSMKLSLVLEHSSSDLFSILSDDHYSFLFLFSVQTSSFQTVQKPLNKFINNKYKQLNGFLWNSKADNKL